MTVASRSCEVLYHLRSWMILDIRELAGPRPLFYAVHLTAGPLLESNIWGKAYQLDVRRRCICRSRPRRRIVSGSHLADRIV